MTHNVADPYRDWDAAYVLGALTPPERQEYEQHLAQCAECSDAVTQLAGMPGILGKLPADEAMSVGAASAQPGSDVIRALSARVRRVRMRSRLLAATIAVAACAASVGITLAVTGPDAGAGQSQTGQTQAGGKALRFSAVTASSLTATGTLLPEAWGTRIDWTCVYGAALPGAESTGSPTVRYPAGSAEASRGYALLVTDADGATIRVASWVARPGSVVTPTATTRIPATDIRRVEIQAMATGRTLLAATP